MGLFYLLTLYCVIRGAASSRPVRWYIAALEYWQATRYYALNQLIAVVRYLRLCFWPHPLVMDYGVLSPGEITLSLPHAAIVAVLLAGTMAILRRPSFGFLGLWFFAVLAPSSTSIPLMIQPLAEKRMYLPLAAVVTAVITFAYMSGRQLLEPLGLANASRSMVGRIVGLSLTGRSPWPWTS
jgi:hypothetical protein